MTHALELKDVWLTFPTAEGPLDVLKGVSLAVEPGGSVAIVGPSGSGKSSLISVAAGLEKPSRGEVSLLGERIESLGEDQLARLRRGRVSMVFQSFHLLETMTAFDNVRTPLEIAGLDRVSARANDWLDRVGLSRRRLHYPGQLSGGERQRVAVARALSSDPALVFADEPTGNLDAESGRGVADLLFDLTNEGSTTLVIVTHDDELAARAARIVHMRDGRIV
ncbi:ABC transporter ATP-binding protein [Hyphomonas johnsonii]|uniref:ABC transporter-like protein n=1 Tax=Hyphomonas johnsonii MHS-2 TaxID=1280950 RepID=A0A059FRE2_9PROT|nr:ABC transporter ATP-binding protein [Hyphomonas johnsonii]KCZ93182.1 ABC transporter-like protein [Hyphomonas johnsonii MHS-2]